MSHFAEAFWSTDYASGLVVLFAKLQQGVKENEQLLVIARMRADAEDFYGQQLGEITPATDRVTDGFSRDDGASVRKAYDGVRTEMMEAASKHRKIASNIRELVVIPFTRWCDQHAARVQGSQDDLHARIKALERQAQAVGKLRSQYFNKCRLVEDLEEEDKLAFKEPQTEPQTSPTTQTPTVKVQEPDEFDEPPAFEIGDNVYQLEQMKKILAHILDNVKLGEVKVPILGTYQNVSSGADIVEYIQKHMNGTTVSYAERVGQDLITCGFLRLVGNVGNTFANSSRMNYQWRPKTFQLAGYPETKRGLARSNTTMSIDSPDSGIVDIIAGWNPLNNAHPNETPAGKLHREAREADERYKNGVRKLDLLRCTLEEAMIDHLRFMERCELDRLKAVKSVILDFSGSISNVIPSLQSTIDKMMLFQETVQPLADLRYLLENYRTGPFIPKVQPYENYYNSVNDQTFGIDLEARARADRKRVPLIITSLLMFLDQHYPLLDGDEARRAIWTVDVPLAATHRLRNEVNNGKVVPPDVLEKYEVPIVASLLKLYLLELPDSIVSSSIYEIIKSVYSSPQTADLSSPTATATRISVLQNTLSQLRLANIASLDAILTHFARLIDLTSADETYVNNLTTILAPCVLRPKGETSLQFDEKCHVRLVRDLLAHKEQIFTELKRSSTLQHSASVARAASTAAPQDNRSRAFSTDESNRRAHMEERNRAIASRSRASSPAPRDREGMSTPSIANQRHRRDSSRGPETRFPVHPANISTTGSPGLAGISSPRSNKQPSSRRSLEVPGEGVGSASVPTNLGHKTNSSLTDQQGINGQLQHSTLKASTSNEPEKPKPPPKTLIDKPLAAEPDAEPEYEAVGIDLSSASGGVDFDYGTSLSHTDST